MPGNLSQSLQSHNTTQELCNYLEDVLDSKNIPTWSSDAATILLNFVEKVSLDGNVLCANSITKVLNLYAVRLDDAEISSIIPIYLRLNNLVDLTLEWESENFLVKVAFWESVNELHMKLFECYSKLLHEYLVSIGSLLVKSCLDAKTNLFLRQLRIKALNFSLENTTEELRNRFRTSNPNCLEQLLNTVGEIGDYDFQTSLIESVFRLTSSLERSNNVAAWLSKASYKAQKLFVRIKDFDPDCRRFLNLYNPELGIRRKVFSYPAVRAQMGNFVLKRPNVPMYENLWVDFNLGSSTISVMFDKAENRATASAERCWETIALYSHEVDSVLLKKMATGYTLVITIGGDPVELFATPPSQEACNLLTSEFRIDFEEQFTNIEYLCHALYEDKLKVCNEARKKSITQDSKTTSPGCISEQSPSRKPLNSNKQLELNSANTSVTEPSPGISEKSAIIQSYILDPAQSREISKQTYLKTKLHMQASQPMDNIQCIMLSDLSLEAAINFATPRRTAPNQNFSSESSTSIYPSSSRKESFVSEKQGSNSKLKQILNKGTPKRKYHKHKASISLSIPALKDKATKLITTRIYKTDEAQPIDVSSDEDIIPSSVGKQDTLIKIDQSTDTTLGCLASSSSTDEDVVPSSIKKESVSNEKSNVRSLTDVLEKKNILKLFDKSESLRRSVVETLEIKCEKEDDFTTGTGKAIKNREENKIDNTDTIKGIKIFEEEDSSPMDTENNVDVKEDSCSWNIRKENENVKKNKSHSVSTGKEKQNLEEKVSRKDLKNIKKKTTYKNGEKEFSNSKENKAHTLDVEKEKEYTTDKGKEILTIKEKNSYYANTENEIKTIKERDADTADKISCGGHLGIEIEYLNEKDSKEYEISKQYDKQNVDHCIGDFLRDSNSAILKNTENAENNKYMPVQEQRQEDHPIIETVKSVESNLSCINLIQSENDSLEFAQPRKDVEVGYCLDSETCVGDPDDSVISFRNLNDISVTEIVIDDADVALRYTLPDTGIISNVKPIVPEGTDVESISATQFSSFNNEAVVIENDHQFSSKLTSQEFQCIAGSSKAQAVDDAVYILDNVPAVLEKIISQVEERDCCLDVGSSQVNRFSNTQKPLCVIGYNSSKSTVDVCAKVRSVAGVIDEATVNVDESDSLDKEANINRAFLVEYGPNIIVKHLGNNVEFEKDKSYNYMSDDLKTEDTAYLADNVSPNVNIKKINSLHKLHQKTDLDDSNVVVPDDNKISSELMTGKKSPSSVVALTLKILSDYPLKYPNLKTPQKSEHLNSESTKNNSESRKQKRKILPDHYKSNCSSDAALPKQLNSSSRKRLFNSENSLLESTPPEDEISEVSIIGRQSCEKSRQTVAETRSKKMEERQPPNSYQIFRSKQKAQKQANSEQNVSLKSTVTITKHKHLENLTENSKRSIFSDLEGSDSSSSEKWLHKKTLNKSSMKTYSGKRRKRSYYDSSDSDVLIAEKRKRKKKENHILPRPYSVKDSTSEAEDFKLFKSPKSKLISQAPLGRKIITRSMTGNLKPRIFKESIFDKKFNSDIKNRQPKREFSSVIEVLGDFGSSPEVQRDTSLSHAGSSCDDTSQLSNLKLVNSKISKRRKSEPDKLDNGSSMSRLDSNIINVRKDLRKEKSEKGDIEKRKYLENNSPLTLESSSEIHLLPPNPSNTPIIDKDTRDFNTDRIYYNFHPVSEENILPKSTSSPRFAYVEEARNTSENVVDPPCKKISPQFKDTVMKLYFEDSGGYSRDNSIENTCKGSNMIVSHPNTDYSSSEEINSSQDLIQILENDKNKAASKKTRALYHRNRHGNVTEIRDESEIVLSPLIPQSLKIMSSPLQKSQVLPPESLCQKQTIAGNVHSVAKPNLSESNKTSANLNKRKVDSLVKNTASITEDQLLDLATPRSRFISKDSHETPPKPVPRSLLLPVQHSGQNSDLMYPESNNDSQEPGISENSREYATVHISTLKLLMDEVMSMKEICIQNCHRCSIIFDILKSMGSASKSGK